MDSSSRARVLHSYPSHDVTKLQWFNENGAYISPSFQASVCPNTAYNLRRDAWMLSRRVAAAAALQAAARVLCTHALIHRGGAAALLQRTWRQHAALAAARAAGGSAVRGAAVRIQSAWRGHWLRVKKVRLWVVECCWHC
jgi:hypothetical protein